MPGPDQQKAPDIHLPILESGGAAAVPAAATPITREAGPPQRRAAAPYGPAFVRQARPPARHITPPGPNQAGGDPNVRPDAPLETQHRDHAQHAREASKRQSSPAGPRAGQLAVGAAGIGPRPDAIHPPDQEPAAGPKAAGTKPTVQVVPEQTPTARATPQDKMFTPLRKLDARLAADGVDVGIVLTRKEQEALAVVRTTPELSSTAALGKALGRSHRTACQRILTITKRLSDMSDGETPPRPRAETGGEDLPVDQPPRYKNGQLPVVIRELDAKLAAMQKSHPGLSPAEADLATYLPDERFRELLALVRGGQSTSVMQEKLGFEHSASVSKMQERLLGMARQYIPNRLFPRDLLEPSVERWRQQPGSFGEGLDLLIRRSGLTQAEFADRIGGGLLRMNRVINGRRLPMSPSFARDAARILKATPDEAQALLGRYLSDRAARREGSRQS